MPHACCDQELNIASDQCDEKGGQLIVSMTALTLIFL